MHMLLRECRVRSLTLSTAPVPIAISILEAAPSLFGNCFRSYQLGMCERNKRSGVLEGFDVFLEKFE